MKKLICAAALSLILFIPGCAKRQEGLTGEGTPIIPGAGREAVSSSLPPENEPLIDATPYVADAPIYRGTVVEREEEGGHLLLKLESAAGVDFGYPSILMQTSPDTKAGFALGTIQVGDHLEVFFGDRADGLPPIILSATKLPPAADTVYNGEVVRCEEADEGGRLLELMPLEGGERIIFHISDDTRLYLDEKELAPGKQVNVYHRGTLTRSVPPQGVALEVRPYSG